MTLKEDYPIDEHRLEDSDIPGKEKHARNIEIVWGLMNGSKQKDIAALFEISPERVRQLWILTSIKQTDRLRRERREAILDEEDR